MSKEEKELRTSKQLKNEIKAFKKELSDDKKTLGGELPDDDDEKIGGELPKDDDE